MKPVNDRLKENWWSTAACAVVQEEPWRVQKQQYSIDTLTASQNQNAFVGNSVQIECYKSHRPAQSRKPEVLLITKWSYEYIIQWFYDTVG